MFLLYPLHPPRQTHPIPQHLLSVVSTFIGREARTSAIFTSSDTFPWSSLSRTSLLISPEIINIWYITSLLSLTERQWGIASHLILHLNHQTAGDDSRDPQGLDPGVDLGLGNSHQPLLGDDPPSLLVILLQPLDHRSACPGWSWVRILSSFWLWEARTILWPMSTRLNRSL